MKRLNPDCPLSRHSRAGGNPVDKKIPAKQDRREDLFASRSNCSCWIPACAGMTQLISSGVSGLFAALLFTCLTISTANADNLGRLFFTPAQRAQLDYTHAHNAPAEGNSSSVLTVNGIVQKHGGARTVWVNGVAQSAGNNNERNPTAQTVTVPGKSQPVKIKVGEKILLNQPAPANQEAFGQ